MTTAPGATPHHPPLTAGAARMLEIFFHELDLQACLYLCDMLGMFIWTCDVSFISLTALRPAVWHRLISDERISNRQRFKLVFDALESSRTTYEMFS